MNWFKNLNAAPRLLISFGVMLVLTLGISYLAVSALSKANERVRSLYQEDMKGVMSIENISTNKLDMARQDRDAMVNIEDTNVRSADLDALKADFVKMHANVEAAEHTFSSTEEKSVIGAIRDVLPGYEKAVMLIVDAIAAKDLAGAKAKLAASAPIAAEMLTDIEHARQVKETVAEERYQANNQAYQTARTLIVGAAVVSLLLGVILSFGIARGFSLPLGQAVAALEKVAGGDLTASLEVDTKDEVGRMAEALNKAVEKLSSTMREVADSAANASSSAQQLAAASEAIASGAQEQAASLEETSASLEQISSSVRLSADNARNASELATGSRNSAVSNQDGASAVAAMAEISKSSVKISDIISTVDEIAFQTNLLAVNAAVEAARAGDEGRGFAVVASEVRSLAQRSSGAAKEIKGLIQDSLRKVERGSELVNRVAQLVGEIALTSAEQSTGIEQVNTAMTQMDQVTQSNSAQTEELSATAESLSEQAARLLELMETFVLNRGPNNEYDRQAASFHHASASHPLHPLGSVQQIIPRGLSAGRGARNFGPAKTGLPARGAMPIKSRQPAMALSVPCEPAADDRAFEEF